MLVAPLLRCLILCAPLLVPDAIGAPIPALEAKFTQVINQVDVVAQTNQAAKAAKVQDTVRSPDWVRTGAKARAELVAADQTITRIGANSLFSFEADSRTMRLQQGSLLFHSPAGRGGGAVRTGGAVAAVLGTTLIVSATPDGGFKAIVLEGKGKVSLPSGQTRQLRAGQLVFVLGGTGRFGPLMDINLGRLVEGSALVRSFDRKLPSLEKIEREVHRQERRLSRGELEDTGELIGGQVREEERKLGASDASILDRIFGDEYIPAVKFALERDTRIDGPALEDSHIFLDGFDLQLYNFPYDDYIGYAARNITLSTPTLTLGPFPKAVPDYFDIVAGKELHVAGSLVIESEPSLPLFLTGIERLTLAGGVELTYANSGGIHLISGGSTAYSGDAVMNPAGPVWVQSVNGDLSLTSCHVQGGSVDLHAGKDLTVTDSHLAADGVTTVASLSDRLAPKPGDLSTVGSAPEPYGTVGNISIIRTSIAGGAAGELRVRAADVLRIDTVGLSNLRSISLGAQTLDLKNINFPAGSSVSLASSLGILAPQPNTGANSIPGHVNFIQNVSYGGNPAQNAIGNGITIRSLQSQTGAP